MSAAMEVPLLSDLDGLAVEVGPPESLGLASVTCWADDGSVVTLRWDEIAKSVHVRWTESGEDRLIVEREAVTKVSVRENSGRVEFWVWSDGGSLGGQLVVRVGERVHVSDALLRR
ncbi:hypothetical protein [Agromyces salentinus]|uniref:Uncharacterized protein n=1 Tax=Agromyces salentinus TaxID=269421 RepID=A0ABN2N0D5_9MICO|nr:hypothetical protein [Agromyces salentinus]